MRALFAVIGVSISLLSGCGTITSIYRKLDLDTKVVAIDAKQRAIATSPASGTYVLCAEPSPDALSSYGSSISGTLLSSNAQAQLAQAFAEQSASIGLRTQSIQLMRDAMYRACEGYLSGGLDSVQFDLLQRRFQNLTLGLLAIEQLTGALKAEQANLSSASGAGTGDNTEQESEALKNARTAQDSAQDEADLAANELEIARKAFQDANNELIAAKAALAAENPQTPETKSKVAAAEEKLTTKTTEFNNKKAANDSKQRAVATAKKNTIDAEQNLALAKSRVKAFASGVSQFGPAGQNRLAVTDKVATKVHEIVKTVLEESGSGESCHAVIRASTVDKEYYSKQPGKDVLDKCLAIAYNELNTRKAEATNRARELEIRAKEAATKK